MLLYNILSLAYNKINDLENARLNMLECLMLAPDYYEALNNYGLILQKLGYETDAIIQFKKALKIKPDFAEAFNNMGLSQRNLGSKREAKINLKKAIRLDAQLCISYNNLKDLHTFSSEDPLIFQMEELLSDNGLQDSEKCHLHFALSKAYEDLDDLTTSYSHLKTGNALRKKVLKYDFSEDVQAFEKIKLNTQNIKKVISSFDTDAQPKPIFILGMMRSGTTLVEQIVSRHSRVTGAGELGYLGRFGYDLAIGLKAATSENIKTLRDSYLTSLQQRNENTEFITDKMPVNFKFINLIKTALPEAKIIHVHRDPKATCWSNFKHYFSSNAHGFCYDLNDTVQYYKLYEDLMNFGD